jgi:hypothetical protein
MSHLDPADSGETPCKCGRILRKIHCPDCGAYWTRFLRRELRTPRHSASQQEVRVFLCRRCGITFDEFGWGGDLCNAPQYFTKETNRRQKRIEEAQKAVSSLGSNTLTEIAEEVFGGDQKRAYGGVNEVV